jgi:hypothetical protein
MLTKIISLLAKALSASADAKFLATSPIGLLPPDKLEQKLRNPRNFTFAISPKTYTDLYRNYIDRTTMHSIYTASTKIKRDLFNNILPIEYKQEIFREKLFRRENLLQNAAECFGLELNPVELTEVICLSSSDSTVYRLTFAEKQHVILKHCIHFLNTPGSKFKGFAENELFAARYLKEVCGLENVMRTSAAEENLVFLEFLDGEVSNRLFVKNIAAGTLSLAEKYKLAANALLRQLAQNAAALDLLGKGDRTLNPFNNQNAFGNYMINGTKLYAIDHGILFNANALDLNPQNTQAYLRNDAEQGKLETAFLLTSRNLAADKQIFREEYRRTLNFIRAQKEQILALLKEVFVHESEAAIADRIRIISEYLNRTDEQWDAWLDYILSEETLQKSLVYILTHD